MSTRSAFAFVTVDVFTQEPFGGNPLAVVPDARGLATAQMQAIAMEFNLSETTFVLPPRDAAHTAQVRIFTPRQELPFAGHPNVGTAYVLAQQGECFGRPIGDRVEFEELAGLVPIELERAAEGCVGARLESPQPFSRGASLPAAAVAEAASLAVDAIDTMAHAPCFASCGLSFAVARVQSLEALAAAVPVVDAFARHMPRDAAGGLMLYTINKTAGASTQPDIQARVFAPLHGITEDPATGSANVALAGLLAELAPEADLILERTVAQGVEMGRPSLLRIAAEKAGGAVRVTRVGGRCVPMLSGTLPTI